MGEKQFHCSLPLGGVLDGLMSMLILSGAETLLERHHYYVYFLPLTSSIWCLTACSAPFIAQAACKTPPP